MNGTTTLAPNPSKTSAGSLRHINVACVSAWFCAEAQPAQRGAGTEASATSNTCTRPAAKLAAKYADAGTEVSAQDRSRSAERSRRLPPSLATRRYSSGPLNSAAHPGRYAARQEDLAVFATGLGGGIFITSIPVARHGAEGRDQVIQQRDRGVRVDCGALPEGFSPPGLKRRCQVLAHPL
jgi:hypothetical protein